MPILGEMAVGTYGMYSLVLRCISTYSILAGTKMQVQHQPQLVVKREQSGGVSSLSSQSTGLYQTCFVCFKPVCDTEPRMQLVTCSLHTSARLLNCHCALLLCLSPTKETRLPRPSLAPAHVPGSPKRVSKASSEAPVPDNKSHSVTLTLTLLHLLIIIHNMAHEKQLNS
jgi:hypothetical protein